MRPPEIGVGMLGYAFMGQAHAAGYDAVRAFAAPARVPRLRVIAGRSADAVHAAADRYGFDRAVTDWRELVADDAVELFDNAGPNGLHLEPTVAAAQAGKHVVCEKPLGRNADEAFALWSAVAATGVEHLCAFNYRFVPAVRLARELLEAGELGEIRHFRARYLQDWIADPAFPHVWRLSAAEAGSGALGDIGSHVVDLARYLVGEPVAVTGALRTFVGAREGGEVDVDDAFAATVEFDGGAVGTLEASRFATGRKNALSFEVNGSRGSLAFDLERLNELELYLPGERDEAGGGASALGAGGDRTAGFQRVLVTEPNHPFISHWWPPGHVIGWQHTFAHELDHLLTAIAGDGEVAPHGATFADGYRAAEVCDAIARSARTGHREAIAYRAPS